jgi:uncharacterized protein (DUF1499 family)
MKTPSLFLLVYCSATRLSTLLVDLIKFVRPGFLAAFLLIACTMEQPKMLGIHNNKLSPCPSSPNCVCSDSKDEKRYIEPYQLSVDSNKAWAALKKVITSLPQTTIISNPKNYLHAEVRSLIFHFVDDIEFHLRPQRNIIAVRSAARLGYYDFGVNRRRVEKIRKKLQAQGVIR